MRVCRSIPALFASLLLACQAPPPPPRPKAVPPSQEPAPPTPPPKVEPPVPSELTVLVHSELPKGFSPDGKLDEWASLSTSTQMVHVVVTGDKLVIASSVAVHLALSSPFPAAPAIGWFERGGGTVPLTEVGCENQYRPKSMAPADPIPNPPEVVKRCKGMLKRYATFVSDYEADFVRRLQLSAETVKVDGITPENTTIATSGTAVETVLPLSAMPRVAQAPLVEMLTAASVEPLPELDAPAGDASQGFDGWTSHTLTPSVAFSPRAELRAALFADGKKAGRTWPGEASYHPASPELFEAVEPTDSEAMASGMGKRGPTRTALVTEERPLFELVEELGDVKVGIVRWRRVYLVTEKANELLGLAPMAPLKGVARRGADLHVFAYRTHGFRPDVGNFDGPTWLAFRVAADGTITEVAEPSEGAGVFPWDTAPKPFHNKEFTSFGMRGVFRNRNKTLTYAWDPKEQKYLYETKPFIPIF